MKLIQSEISFIIVLSFIINQLFAQDQIINYPCKQLRETCSTTEECCIGTCVQRKCHDGLYIKDRNVNSDVTDAIAQELKSGLKTDVSEHPNIIHLPSIADCGYSTLASSKDKFNGHTVIRRKRIVGGDAIEVGAYPWLVQLYLHNISFGNQYFHCGGTLINNRTVLTAAHCLTRIPTATTLKTVVVGNVDRRQSMECDAANIICTNSKQYGVEEIVVHEGYSEGNTRNDIGLIRLNRDVAFNDFIRPICLPRTEEIFQLFKNGKYTVLGWGTQNKATDSGNKVISWKAQAIQTNLVSRENCNRFYSRITGKLQKSQICAGGYPGKGDCQGDSGGPLFKLLPVAKNHSDVQRYFQFGVVSTGSSQCGKQGKPSVYTSVMYFMNWILDNIVEPPAPVVAVCTNCTITPTRVKAYPELSTGINMDVRKYTNAKLLPQFPDCGPVPDIIPHHTIHEQSKNHSRTKRVIGGRPFGLGSMAWMVQIYTRNSITLERHLTCGGFIISSKYVLTAAQCVTEITSPFAIDSIVIGNYNRLQDKECTERECRQKEFIPIEDIIVHEYFAKYTFEYDIALIRLPEEIKFSKLVQPICLPQTEDFIYEWGDSRFTIAGWGRVSPSGDADSGLSNILLAVNVTLKSRKYCDNVYSRQTGVLDESRFCAGGEPGIGECTGDMGGPTMRWIKDYAKDGGVNVKVTRYYAFGITSWVPCGEQGIPGIYTSILYHMPWILRHMQD